MKKPIIGITTGEMLYHGLSWSPIAYGLMQTYVEAIIRAHGVPVVLPITNDDDVRRELYETCDALLFIGGDDIAPAHYGAEKHAVIQRENSITRDNHELALMRAALDDDKPVLGICRGMQLMNVSRGGTLYQDIVTQIPGSLNHNLSRQLEDITHTPHEIDLEPSSEIARLLGKTRIRTNELHFQAIKDIGQGIVPCGWAEDTIIEAIELPDRRFAIGTQLHPEALAESVEPAWQRLFDAFVTAATAANLVTA